MIDVYGDFWEYPATHKFITTNGFVKKNGHCVMGRGVAKEMTDRYPTAATLLGSAIHHNGNVVNYICADPYLDPPVNYYSFPVKHNWFENADLNLIAASADYVADNFKNKACLIPRPGCGNGKLDYFTQVRPIISQILPDNVKVITWAAESKPLNSP